MIALIWATSQVGANSIIYEYKDSMQTYIVDQGIMDFGELK